MSAAWRPAAAPLVFRARARAVVIGSGFGGLAAAIRLQSAGVRTVLVEKRDRPGGRAASWVAEGFRFDAGPTVITAPPVLEELFALSGRRMRDAVTLLPVDPFYRLFWSDGDRFDYNGDQAALEAQIARRRPRDVEGYRRFLAYSRHTFAEGFTRLAHVPFLDWWSMVRVAPQLARLGAWRSVHATVSRFLEDERLRQAFGFHSLLVGGHPFRTPAIYTLIHALEREWGVFFPRGGTGALVAALVRLFEDLGGELLLDAPVDRIVTSGGRVRAVALENGRLLRADAVVSNADVVHTYRALLREDPPSAAQGERLARRPHGMSLFLVYFGTRRRWPELAHHNVLFGPRYRGLLDDIFDRGRLPPDLSLYLHAPTTTDPTMAPPGGESFYVLAPVPHLGRARVDWAREAPALAAQILEDVERRLAPGLREAIVTSRVFTPADFARDLNAHLGSAFSLEPLLRQSAYFRVANRDARLRGLYFVGAGTHPGAGVPGVVSSAKATVGLVLDDLARARAAALQ
jgi:phytoene desaturase